MATKKKLTKAQKAGYKAWETRRANKRKADYRARGLKAWETRCANEKVQD